MRRRAGLLPDSNPTARRRIGRSDGSCFFDVHEPGSFRERQATMAAGKGKIDVAVLGATGSVGQRYIELLDSHPQFRLAELFGSERSAGKRYADIADWRTNAAPPDEAANMDVKHHEEPV